MTPKEKAKQLLKRYEYTLYLDKECALIAVDEILIALTVLPYGVKYLYERDYWQEVKEEIEKL